MTSVDQALRERIRQVEELSSENERLRKDNDCLRKKNEALLKKVARLKNMYDEAEQVIDATVPPQVFTLTDVQQDSEKLAFYTGFESLKKFLAFIKFVRTGYDSYKQRQAPQGRPLNLSMEDQLLLVLSRLRVWLLEQDLAYRFGVHVSTVSRVWTFWVGFLADHLAQSVGRLHLEATADCSATMFQTGKGTNRAGALAATQASGDVVLCRSSDV
ncbi:hypothetical protein HPB47_018963 [Ixodes persulcatus]|uniref:Uncharacterized protein n=1 Tax=Ixodes persulcatus TaxID=34615 RepID=A0AC60QJE0_IXOPE|nr:hypothetical protein HPB47_018963 [Ixodes persulcatus]